MKTFRNYLIILFTFLIALSIFSVSKAVNEVSNETSTDDTTPVTPVVEKIELKKAKLTVNTNARQYSGKAITPSVKLYYNNKKLVKDVDYSVNYYNNKKIGVATIKITGKGNYTGTIYKYFTIRAKTPRTYYAKNYSTNKKTGNIKVKIRWRKDNNVTGYKIYMAKNKKNGKYTRVRTIDNKNVTTFIKAKLNPKVTYYFKIVAYNDVKVNGKVKRINSKDSNIVKKPAKMKLLANITLTSYTSSASRNTNLKIATSTINGTVLKPGQNFVWSQIVGPATYAKGYKDAPVFIGKKHAMGTGGGICQVSSTLYQAVRKCKFKIIERHQHSLPVSYTTLGNDATVSHGVNNFIFKNNKKYSVKIEMSSKGGSTTCKIYRLY